MFARLLHEFGVVRGAEMAGEGATYNHLRAFSKGAYWPACTEHVL